MSDVSSMSSVQSKSAKFAKKQENVTCMERRQFIETDEEMAPIIDLKCMDVSAVIMNKFKILMEIQDQMFDEMKETLKNDLKAILGAKTTIPEGRNSENSSHRTEFQQLINSVSQTTGKAGKIEGENSKIIDDTENLTFKIKVDELSGKLDNPNEYNSDEGKKLPQNESRTYKVMGNMEETLCNVDDRQRNRHIHLELREGETRENGEDESLEVREERKIPKFKNKEKMLKASREEKMLDEGTVLTLAADLSSATLDVSKQWSNVFNILREHDFEPKFLCDVKLAFKCDGEIKTFSDLQSLRKFASQKSSMKELLKEVLLQKEEINRGGRYGIQENGGNTLLDSKHRAGEMTNDGLNFLFIKEVKVAKPGEMNNLETEEEEFSELELLDEEGSGMEDEGEETSELEDEEEEASELEEETEEEQSSAFCKETEERHRTLQTEELTSKESDLTQEIENLSSVINSIREIQEEIGNLKSSHPGVLEIKNSVGDLSSRMDLLEERIDSLEDQIEEFSKDTVQMTKQIIHKERQREREDISRSSNIRLIGIPEKENNENGAEDIIKEIIDENFAELKKGSSLEIVSACRVPSKIDEKRLTPRHILVKFSNSNDKEKIIRASRERREITYQRRRIRLTADLSLDTLDARSKWSNIFRALLEKGFNPRILYPAKLAFDFGGKTKVFLDTEEFRDYVSHMPTLRELLENIL
ncbi:LINE-1 type transposase domain-containing protein 1 [Sapajus apella]|uniref:LINE-1 type transposase domain-containing protein 1 n=1 Tax=Sapajus apella TaxID=9515 RepID=A0A6J3JE09_SAPAP|nr:LINE-1 type transposase domain-containing protein 1 [Sapajus apella]XP_032152718.1 LINE-1 type transposase domain-containing protein 1 [Sapajus apella]XP_032152719.1 LINE-1 type transposase domain-containing protein 1 [Sapajus apella]